MLRKMSLYIQKTETWKDLYSPKKEALTGKKLTI